MFYGCLSNTPVSPLYNFQITVSGATFVAAAPSSFSQGEIHSDFGTGLIYSDDGNVANPGTQQLVGTYNASGPQVAPDPSLNRVFILGQTAVRAFTNNFTIESFDQKAYTPVSSITINNLVGSPFAFVRCGPSCLALLTVNDVEIFLGYTGSLGMLYLIQDPIFVSNANVAASSLPKPQDLVLSVDGRASPKQTLRGWRGTNRIARPAMIFGKFTFGLEFTIQD